MAIFKMHCIKACTIEKSIIYYDNLTSELFDENRELIDMSGVEYKNWSNVQSAFAVSAETPGTKDIPGTKRLKIQLGLACNYKCDYCIQGHEHVDSEQLPLDKFINLLPEKMDLEVIEFWGGEPLLYWKTLKPLAEALRKRYGDNFYFYMATNGSLLTYEINEWLIKMGFHVSVSHDGPGQAVRGKDPLADLEQRAIIFDSYKRLPKGGFSFNAMTHKQNASRHDICQWFKKEIDQELGKGFEFFLGEGAFFSPKTLEHRVYCLNTYDEIINYRRTSLFEIREGSAPNSQIIPLRLHTLNNIIVNRIPLRVMYARCAADKEDVLIVDLSGNVFSCQNASPNDIAANGKSHTMGNLQEPGKIKVDAMTHWSYRSECVNCPALALCLGGCPTRENSRELQELNCDMLFSDNIPFFAAVIEMITGFIPYYIEGPQPEDRKDIFGVVVGGDENLLDD